MKNRIMDIKYNKEKLSQILENVYELLQTPIRIFDKDFSVFDVLPARGVFNGILPHDLSIARTVEKMPYYKVQFSLL